MKKTMTLTLAASILSLTLSAFPYPAAASTIIIPLPPKPPSVHSPVRKVVDADPSIVEPWRYEPYEIALSVLLGLLP